MSGPIPAEWRDYRLVCLTGWTEEQILDQRSQWLDWLLEFDRMMYEMENTQNAGDAGG